MVAGTRVVEEDNGEGYVLKVVLTGFADESENGEGS